MQVVEINLKKGETIYSEAGGMSWMTDNINMHTEAKGGFMKSIGRMFSGESFFLVNYTCQSNEGKVVFSNEFPGKILNFNLKDGESIICQKDSFMVAEQGVTLETHFRKKLGTGLFGGEGFILQKVSGPGNAFLEANGEIVEQDLKPGEVLKIDPGHIAFYEPQVQYNLTTIKGIKNVLFGGEGLFLAELIGPGKVWLQSMPLSNLANKLIPYLPKATSKGTSINFGRD